MIDESVVTLSRLQFALTHALVPGTCVVAPDAIFIDGFDSN
jgi:hypothetical protein